MSLTSFTAAVVQAAPVLFDRDASIEKACGLIRESAENGAQLIVFPEAFIPCYPRGFSFGMVVGSRTRAGRALWQRYWENAVEIPSPATDALVAAAHAANAIVVIGIIEREGGTLYCTTLYVGSSGILGKHRKLKPTGSERLIWGEGDASTLTVLDTPLGRIGGLICWENYMPLARMAMYTKGVEIYCAPTADSRDGWHATMQHIALEGRCYVLGCNQFVTKAMVPVDLRESAEMEAQPEVMCRGGSTIVSPLGEVLAGPLYGEEGILYAELDSAEIIRSKVDFDVVGHYSRPDVFEYRIRE